MTSSSGKAEVLACCCAARQLCLFPTHAEQKVHWAVLPGAARSWGGEGCALRAASGAAGLQSHLWQGRRARNQTGSQRDLGWVNKGSVCHRLSAKTFGDSRAFPYACVLCHEWWRHAGVVLPRLFATPSPFPLKPFPGAAGSQADSHELQKPLETGGRFLPQRTTHRAAVSPFHGQPRVTSRLSRRAQPESVTPCGAAPVSVHASGWAARNDAQAGSALCRHRPAQPPLPAPGGSVEPCDGDHNGRRPGGSLVPERPARVGGSVAPKETPCLQECRRV